MNNFTQQAFLSLGVSPEDTQLISEVFALAHWREQTHHDYSYLPQRFDWLYHGKVNPRPEIKKETKFGSIETYTGDNCLGELGCRYILEQALSMAEQQGMAFTSISHSNHYLAGAPYGMLAAKRGMMAFIFSSTDKTMASAQGHRSMIGNNPFAFAAPLPGAPFILDICMAYSSLGTLHKYVREGKVFDHPPGFDSKGEPTTSPQAILDHGALAPMAQHKGFGLALMVELLTGGLNGGQMGLEIPEAGGIGGHSQSVLILNSNELAKHNHLSQRFTDMMDQFKQVDPTVRYPGSRRKEWTEDSWGEECFITEKTRNEINLWAKTLDIESPFR
jgi:LDH2 family malate/lactate/ureidoglycolate dehydrogenase